MFEDISHYNKEGTSLRKAQLRLLDMLEEVDRICKKHNITYWLDGGTSLGAERHQGFIPWDDDLDIAVMRNDYNKLIRVLKEELPDNFTIQNLKNEPLFHMLYSRVVDKNSFFDYGDHRQPYRRKFKYQGVFLDLFYLERGNLKLKKIIDFLYIKSFRILRNSSGLNKYLILKPIAYPVRILSIILVQTLRSISFIFPSEKLIYGYGIPFNWEFRKSEILPVKQTIFEGDYYPAPNSPHEYLKRCFGNYLEIPPVEERRTHAKKIEVYENKSQKVE